MQAECTRVQCTSFILKASSTGSSTSLWRRSDKSADIQDAAEVPEGAVHAGREDPALGGGQGQDVALEHGHIPHVARDGSRQVVLPQNIARAPACAASGISRLAHSRSRGG